MIKQHLVSFEAKRADLQLTADEIAALTRYLELLIHWGQHINLTSCLEIHYLIEHHFPDAFFLVSWLSRYLGDLRAPGTGLVVGTQPIEPSPSIAPPLFAVDIGSGGGLPGIILAVLLPRLQLTLVEANQRKCSFLRTVAAELNLSLSIHAKRLEHMTLPPFDFACSRATWSVEEWLSKAYALVRPGGVVATFLVHPYQLPRSYPLVVLEHINYILTDGSPRCISFFKRIPSVGP